MEQALQTRAAVIRRNRATGIGRAPSGEWIVHTERGDIRAEAVVNAGVPVTLSLDGGDPVDGGSALMIMTLGAVKGSQVTVTADDEAVLAQVAELVEQDLDA